MPYSVQVNLAILHVKVFIGNLVYLKGSETFIMLFSSVIPSLGYHSFRTDSYMYTKLPKSRTPSLSGTILLGYFLFIIFLKAEKPGTVVHTYGSRI